jgi:hypothetical protein
LFSVALSLGFPPPDVIRHRMSMEPGLSSPAAFRPLLERPSSRLTHKGMGRRAGGVKGPEIVSAKGVSPMADHSSIRKRWLHRRPSEFAAPFGVRG